MSKNKEPKIFFAEAKYYDRNNYKIDANEEKMESVRRAAIQQINSFLESFEVVPNGKFFYIYIVEVDLIKNIIIFDVDSSEFSLPEYIKMGFIEDEEGFIRLTGKPTFLSGKDASGYGLKFIFNVQGGDTRSLQKENPELKNVIDKKNS